MKLLIGLLILNSFYCVAQDSLSFYGKKVLLQNVIEPSFSKCNNSEVIQKFLDKIALEHKEQFNDLDSFVNRYKCDGLAAYLLLQKTCKYLGYSENYSILVSFSFFKEKYDVKLLFDISGKLGIYYYAKNKYKASFFTLNSKRYYAIDHKVENYKVYNDKIFNQNTKLKTFDYSGIPNFISGRIAVKTFVFNYYNPTIDTVQILINNGVLTKFIKRGTQKDTIKFELDLNAISYYEDVPIVLDDSLFVNANASILLENSIEELRLKIISFNDIEKIRYLLSFVQQIPYETYDNRTLKNVSHYPEQTLYQNKGDCDDKTFLLCYLLRKTTNITPYILNYQAGNIHHFNVGIKCDSFGEIFISKNVIDYNDSCYYIAETTSNTDIGSPKGIGLKLINVISLE